MARPVVKIDAVAQQLRQRIVAGDWRPGQRLPPRRALETRYAVSPFTVQRAMDRLRAEGFVESRGRGGTFVAQTPPHLSRYALIFGPGDEAPHSRFRQALVQAAEAVNGRLHDRRLVVHTGVAPGHRTQAYDQLIDQVCTHCFAGLLLALPPKFLRGSPLVEAPGLPRVTISRATPTYGIPRLHPDPAAWVRRAAHRCLQHRRTRVAILGPIAQDAEAVLDQDPLAHAMHTPTGWRLDLPPRGERAARRVVQLLLANQNDRPDALLVTDDHLLQPTLDAIHDAGLREGRDILVVGHANFPALTDVGGGVQRLGFDAAQLLHAAIDMINAQSRGRSCEDQPLDPVFQDELANATPSATRSAT